MTKQKRIHRAKRLIDKGYTAQDAAKLLNLKVKDLHEQQRMERHSKFKPST